MSDEEVCAKLVELDGIGIWTAEMLMLFSMQRRNILSFGDLALVRGMRMVYHHKVIKTGNCSTDIRNGFLLMLPSQVFTFGCGRRRNRRNERLCTDQQQV